MIAFKTLNDCPVDERPSGYPLEWPWIEQHVCDVETRDLLESEGFFITSESEYEKYKIALDPSLETRKTVEVKIQFGIDLAKECIIRLGLIDASTEEVTTMLSALAPIKALLETGALTTAKDVLTATAPGFSGSNLAVLQYAISSIEDFGY